MTAAGWSGCREREPERNEDARVLTVDEGDLHLLDHFDGAAIVDIPLYEELHTSEALAARFQALLAMDEYKPKEKKLFPVEAGKARLNNLTIDRKTGRFVTRDAKDGQASSIEIQADVDLADYDVVSFCFGTSAPGKSELRWRLAGESGYSESKQLHFEVSDRQLRTFSLHANTRALSEAEKRIFGMVYETAGAATQRQSLPAMVPEWHGKLASLALSPTNRAGTVDLRWIALRSSGSIQRLMKERPRELMLQALDAEPIGRYGKDVFVRKFQYGHEIEDGVLTFAPSRLTFEVAVPTGKPTLEFKYLLLPQPLPAAVDDLEFRITASEPDQAGDGEELFRAALQGGLARAHPGAVGHRIDLNRFAGRRILLNFETRLPKEGWEDADASTIGNAGIWLDPVIRQEAETSPDRPNVILVSIDTLRPDHLGAYGYSRDTSPNLDAAAKEGVVFAKAFSTAPWTLPSHMSMLTSLYPLGHGVFEVFDQNGPADQLDPKADTLASVLRDAGYYTFALTDGADLFVAAEYGFCHGFRWMDEQAGGGYLNRRKSGKTIRRMIDWLSQRRRTPFFAFIHSYQVHSPYHAPKPFWKKYVDPSYPGPLGDVYHGVEDFPLVIKKGGKYGQYMEEKDIRHMANLYDGEVAFFDYNFEKLVAELRHRKLLDNTLIVVTSDHGEEFGERGIGGLHGHTLYNDQLRVPLIMRWPKKIPSGTVVKDNVSIVDIMPTVLALCGVDGGNGMHGVSLMEAIEGRKMAPRSLFAAGIRHQNAPKRLDIVEQACITGRYKAIDYGDYKGGARRLFDFEADPRELKDVSKTQPDRARVEFERITQHRRRLPGRQKSGQSRVWTQSDEDRLKTLRALGYSQ